MKLRAYAILDTAVQAYNTPFFSRSDGEAKRAYIHACNKGNLTETAFDTALFHIGEYSDESAALTPNEAPVRLMTGKEARDEALNPS